LDKTLLSPKLASFPSARNAYLALRVTLARTLAEFAEYASRQPSLVTSDEDGLQLPMDTSWCTGRIGSDYSLCKAARDQSSQFDAETAVLLTERFTTSKLVDLARQTELPANLRLQLAKATFVRATILGQETDGKKIAGTLKDLAPAFQDALEKYESAPSSKERQFAAFFLILRQPEMHPYLSAGVSRETPPGKIDNYRDNWWCDWVKPQDESYREFNYYFLWAGMLDDEGKMRSAIDKTWPAFLSETDRQIAQTEWSALARAGSAIETMGDPIIDWAKSRPDDPRVPEALHHLSRVYTYGCHDTTKNYSKFTFQILHKRYPNNEWTKKTPYWF
jgi:hypothetical protein